MSQITQTVPKIIKIFVIALCKIARAHCFLFTLFWNLALKIFGLKQIKYLQEKLSNKETNRKSQAM